MCKGNKLLITAVCLTWSVYILAYTPKGHSETRGELLYSTHCISCHTAKVHWRDQALATDWHSLKVQVRRWQSNIGLKWSENEITDVTHYLNTQFYHFQVTEKQDISGSY